MSGPRIGIVCPYSMGVWGGVQMQVLGLGRALRARGLPVQVLAPCDGLPPEPWVMPLGNSIPYAENGSLAPLAPDPSAQLRLLGAVFDERFDLLHLHEPIAPGPTLTSLVVKPAPLVGTFHASGSIMPYRAINRVVRRLAARLDYRVAVSDEAALTASEALGGTYRIIPNAIEIQRFASAEPWPTDAPTVMFLARHEERKGLRVLLEASRRLPSDVVVWVAGHGPDTDSLRQEFPDARFHWLGTISDDEKERRMRGADVFCVPAVGGESFGVVLLEAMAAQTPVVASDIAAFTYVAEGGASATLFRNRDVADLADKIALALEGGVTIEDRVREGVRRAGQYSMDVQASSYIQLYHALVNGEVPPAGTA